MASMGRSTSRDDRRESPASRRERARKSTEAARSVRIASRAEPRISTTLRLRRSLRKDLEAAAARSGRSVAEVAHELLEEGLRMRQCPGIYFTDEPSGRTAKIGGTGLAVWEVLRDFTRDNDLKRVQAAFPQLSQPQLTAALMYYRRYPDDIRREIEANSALTPESIENQYPGLVRFVTAR
jgi:uncharacterized protein (DUF433 family)